MFSFSSLSEVVGVVKWSVLALLATKVSCAEVVTDVFSDVSSHILTCSRDVPTKISEFPPLEEGEIVFCGQSGDTWWWANGTEMSNISTVPDYKYLTKISQNFLNILVETYTSVCQSVKTSSVASLALSVNRSEGRASVELRQFRVKCCRTVALTWTDYPRQHFPLLFSLNLENLPNIFPSRTKVLFLFCVESMSVVFI